MPDFLTEKQQTTLHHFVRYKKLKKVAEIEHVSIYTIKNRLAQIYTKLRDAGDIEEGRPGMEIVEYVWKKQYTSLYEAIKKMFEAKVPTIAIQGHVCIPMDLYNKVKDEINRKVK